MKKKIYFIFINSTLDGYTSSLRATCKSKMEKSIVLYWNGINVNDYKVFVYLSLCTVTEASSFILDCASKC